MIEFDGSLNAEGEFTVTMAHKPHLYIKTQAPLAKEDDDEWAYMMFHAKELLMEGLSDMLDRLETNEVG